MSQGTTETLAPWLEAMARCTELGVVPLGLHWDTLCVNVHISVQDWVRIEPMLTGTTRRKFPGGTILTLTGVAGRTAFVAQQLNE